MRLVYLYPNSDMKHTLTKSIKIAAWAGLFLFVWSCSALGEPDVQTIYLIRHAEKVTDTGEDDPPLLPEGEARAERTAELLKDVRIDRIYSTPYQRNMATIAPLARNHKVSIKQYEWHDWMPMINEIRANQIDLQTVVICGHGDNLLPMIEAMGCKPAMDSLGAYQHDVYFEVLLSTEPCEVVVHRY